MVETFVPSKKGMPDFAAFIPIPICTVYVNDRKVLVTTRKVLLRYRNNPVNPP